MSLRITRRKFLAGTAAAAGLTVLSGSFKTQAYAANAKLRIAYVGTGGQAGAHLGLAKSEQCPCYCDPDPGPARRPPRCTRRPRPTPTIAR